MTDPNKVERIYAGRRKSRFHAKKKKRIITGMLILLIAILTFSISYYSIQPIIEEKCKDIAISISSEFASIEVQKMADQYHYADIARVEKDEKSNIKMIQIDVGLVNQIMAQVENGVQEGLDQYDEESFAIRLGSFTGSKLLAGKGPKVNYQVQTAGHVQTELKSEFTTQGINQTLHRIYINVISTTTVYTPFHSITETVNSQVLLAEAVIVGEIPSTYYNLEGTDQGAALQVMN